MIVFRSFWYLWGGRVCPGFVMLMMFCVLPAWIPGADPEIAVKGVLKKVWYPGSGKVLDCIDS